MPIVSNPTDGDLHYNTALTNFSQKYLQDSSVYIATRAAPNYSSNKRSDLYTVFNQGDFLRDDAQERAPGTEAAGSGFRLSHDPYYCRTYAYKYDITYEARANADNIIRLERSASQFVTTKALIRRERAFAAAYMDVGKWGTDVTGVSGAPAAGQVQQWNEPGSDPIVDVRRGNTITHGKGGFRFNKAVMGREAVDALLDNDSVLSRVIGGATTAVPANVKLELLAQEFGVNEIFVLDAVYNAKLADSTDPTADDIRFIGGKDALFYYAPDTLDIEEPTAMAQFSWTGFLGASENGMRIDRIPAPLVKADRIEVNMSFDFKVVGKKLGYFFKDVVA